MSTEAPTPGNRLSARAAAAWRAGIWIAVLIAAMAGLYVGRLATAHPPGGEHLAFWPMVAIGTWAAVGHGVPIRDRKASLQLALTEIPMVVGMAYLTPLQALTAAFVGHFVAQVTSRRPVLKILNNSLALSLSFAVGLVVYHLVIGSARPVTFMGWTAVAVALSIQIVLNFSVVVFGAIFRTWRWAYPPLRDMAVQAGLNFAICTVGGILAVSMASVGTWTLLMFAGVSVPAGLGWRKADTARRRYNGLEKLYTSVRRIDLAEGGEREVMSVMLEEARLLLAAGVAAVMVPLEPPLDHLGLSARLVGEGPVVYREAQPLGAVSRLIAAKGPTLLHRRHGKEIASALAEQGYTEAVAVPLCSGTSGPGYLLVADRPFVHEGFDKEDVTMLAALASNAEVVLRKSALLEKLRYEAAVRDHEARHDALTGLPNRENFTALLRERLLALAPGAAVAVLLIDLDGFKNVNDTLGHQMGDMVLAEVARRVGPLAQGGTVVARVGGDEFVVFVPGTDDAAALAQAAQARALIAKPMRVATVELAVGASVGVTVEAAGRTDSQKLLSHADIALHQAKLRSNGTCLYSEGADRTALRRLSMVGELRRAIEDGALELHYQPVHDVGSGRLISCEALARWEHDKFGRVGPDEFIPLAERAGLIDPLTWWALDTALGQVKHWRELVPELKVAVNLSARSLSRPNLVDLVAGALDRAGVSPDALRLELTESSMMAARGKQAIHALSELGVALSIDDFGTGFSSLSRLRRLPFAELKVDRSFVSQMEPGNDDEAIVRSVIEIARGLDKVVTAEGVETRATLDHLYALGCDAAQGYYLGRPVPASAYEALLLAQPCPAGAPAAAPADSPQHRGRMATPRP